MKYNEEQRTIVIMLLQLDFILFLNSKSKHFTLIVLHHKLFLPGEYLTVDGKNMVFPNQTLKENLDFLSNRTIEQL